MISTAAALLAGQALSSAAQVYANNQNVDFQKEQNKMSENLANSAHQREVLDLLAAGLNPILSANGSGAATPNLHAPQVESIGKEAGNTARAIAQYENAQFKAGVEGQKLANRAQEYENSAARHEMLARQKAADVNYVENQARRYALTGEIDVNAPYDNDTFWGLVQQYRNEVKSGTYKSSLGHAVYEDVLQGVNSATGVYRAVKPTNTRR